MPNAPLSLESQSCLSCPAAKGGGRQEKRGSVEEAERLNSKEEAWPDTLGGVAIEREREREGSVAWGGAEPSRGGEGERRGRGGGARERAEIALVSRAGEAARVAEQSPCELR